jgi:hypothetical protein
MNIGDLVKAQVKFLHFKSSGKLRFEEPETEVKEFVGVVYGTEGNVVGIYTTCGKEIAPEIDDVTLLSKAD